MEDQSMLNQELQAEDTEGMYLTYGIGEQLYGVPVADVVQIVKVQEITAVPEMPYYAEGVIDLRGTIIPVIDVRKRFGFEEKEYDDRTCIIITEKGTRVIGLIVDYIDQVTDIDPADICIPPKMAIEGAVQYLTGIAKLQEQTALLMDTDKLLTDEACFAM